MAHDSQIVRAKGNWGKTKRYHTLENAKNNDADAQAGLGLCCLHSTTCFIVMRINLLCMRDYE